MTIDWGALGSVFAVSVAVTVGLVGLFTFGIAAMSRQETTTSSGSSTALARTGAYACFALCAAAVGYGIYVIVTG